MPIDPRYPGCIVSFAGGKGYRRPASPRGYFWDEDANIKDRIRQQCRDAAAVCKTMHASFAVLINIEGEPEPGQPEYAYRGDLREYPYGESHLRDCLAEFWTANVRPMACVRHAAYIEGKRHRSIDVLEEVIDYTSAVTCGGAYFDTADEIGARNWHLDPRPPHNPMPLPYDPQKIITIKKRLNLPNFDVYCEWGDERHDKLGVPVWADPRQGDVRFPGDKPIQRKAYRKRNPNALRVIPCIDVEMLKPERTAEFEETLEPAGDSPAYGVFLFNGTCPPDRPELGATWWVYDLYAKRFGWEPRPKVKVGAASVPVAGPAERRPWVKDFKPATATADYEDPGNAMVDECEQRAAAQQ